MPVFRYSLMVIRDNEMGHVAFSNDSTKALIEQIDYVTSIYKNIGEFFDYLRVNNCLTFNPYGAKITYRAKGEVRTKDLIFDNNLIHQAAKEMVRKKMRDERNAKVSINEDIKNLISRIKSYALNPDIFKKMNSSKLFPYQAKKILEEYINLSKDNYRNITLQADLDEVNQRLEYNLSDYMNLRGVCLWEQKYLLSEQNKKELETEEVDNQINISEYYEKYIQSAKTPDELEYERDMYNAAEELEKYAYESRIKSEVEISNEQIKEIFETGGLTALFEEYGIELYDMLSYEEMIVVGIDPQIVKTYNSDRKR